ncbi:hypothetical protein FRC09_005040 [Ceratobasidium sp. 395]|nr:hypothetical protein FRC09_005040 [Ceratobasidium sp. 395]
MPALSLFSYAFASTALCRARRHKLCGKIACVQYEIFQIPTAWAALAATISKSFAQGNQSGLATLSIPVNYATIDSSTPWLVIPRSLAMPFYVMTLGANPQAATPNPRGASTPYFLPCSTPLTILLQLGGANWTIPTRDLLAEHSNSAHAGTCISNLHTWVDPSEDSVVFGSSFTRSVHVQCFAITELHKRHLSMSRDAHWRGMVIGSTVGGVAGAALLAVGAYLVFRISRASRNRGHERGGVEFVQPVEPQPQPRQPLVRSAKPHRSLPPHPAPTRPGSSSARSHDTSIPLQAAAVPSDAKTAAAETAVDAPIAGPSSRRQLPSHRHLQGSEIRTSTGSQFTEHFGDIAPEYVRGPRARSPLGDKPLPHIPLHPTSSSQAEGSSRVDDPHLSFVPFDAHAQRQGTGSSSSQRKDSISPKNSLPPGAASPVESVGSYKPAEHSHSRDVSI